VLDAIENKRQPNYSMVRYSYDGQVKHLRVVTSFLAHEGEETAGITMVIDDLSELEGLRDSLRAMEQISELNAQLQMRNDLLNRTFGLFLSDEIVRQLLDTPNGLALGGKKKTVAIMMSDLRGFTAISERMDPADTISMLNHYLGAMTEVIQNRGGTIIEFIGDGIMAIFGAPVCRDSFASDAVAAGLEMEAAMEDVNRWNSERDYPPLEMGIGLHIGEVVIGIAYTLSPSMAVYFYAGYRQAIFSKRFATATQAYLFATRNAKGLKNE
jgi:adenylate cyclase